MMPIKVACQCGQQFAAKDQLAGRTVKCPKCGNALQIPMPQTGQSQTGGPRGQGFGGVSATGTGAASAGQSMSQLFDESGMSVAPDAAGKSCPSCMAPMRPEAIICVQCGFNLQIGAHLETEAGPDVSPGGAPSPESETERTMAKAHDELEASPLSIHDATFGDEGVSTYVMTIGMLITLALLLAGGTGLMLTMDFVTEKLTMPRMLVIAGLTVHGLGFLWLSIVSFLENVTAGIITVCAGWIPFIALVPAFMRSGSSLWPFFMILSGDVMFTGGAVTGGMSW